MKGTLRPGMGTPEGSSDSESYLPPVPPARKGRKGSRPRSEVEDGGSRPFGLPPTPKVPWAANCLQRPT